MPSFSLVSGNTPIAVWGTHLDLIQNPQIRAKHGGKEHINVSPRLAGSGWGAALEDVGLSGGSGRLISDTEDSSRAMPPDTGMVGWGSRHEATSTPWSHCSWVAGVSDPSSFLL